MDRNLFPLALSHTMKIHRSVVCVVVSILGSVVIFLLLLGFTNIFNTSLSNILKDEIEEIKTFPYVVALYMNDSFRCTASILSPTTLLSVAHCLNNIYNETVSPEELYGAVGSAAGIIPPSKRISFSAATVYKDFGRKSRDHDIAVLKTTERITFEGNIQPICVASAVDGEVRAATAVGWERIKKYMAEPVKLVHVEQNVLPVSQCRVKINSLYKGDITAIHRICTMSKGSKENNCHGHPSSPLVVQKDNVPLLIGMASFKSDLLRCNNEREPIVFVNVTSYVDFIRDTAADKDICFKKF